MDTSATTYGLISLLISDDLSDEKRNEIFQELVSLPITPDAINEGRKALQERMVSVQLSSDAIDTCGTGGSGMKTINTSTITAFLVTAAGGKVAKHGNRSASGNCGCFDLIEHLGVNIDLAPEQEKEIFEKLGIVFLFARSHHPAMRFVGPLRKEFGKKTIFNYLGPLCNPAGVMRQIIGTGNKEDALLMAGALQKSGSNRAYVVTGEDGLDEVTVTGPTRILAIHDGKMDEQKFSPQDVGLPTYSGNEIEGGAPEENASIFLELVQGEGSEAMKALVLVNATYALMLTDLVSSLPESFELAENTLASGKVFEVFERYRDLSTTLKS
ncbi:anthranilate phosphoribosyltransferase [Patescibacteria group bacterium]|nr:anthranilate phosphoribosyltransferase [Patescibacteria group bacterium]MBU2259579.1 anthranilate phosphoribosyltransferase [Patescibacteria group bacterium]